MNRFIFVLFAIVVCIAVMGCGGGGGGSHGPSQAANVPLPEAQVRLAETATTVFEQTLQAKSISEATQAVADWATTQPSIAASGVSDDGHTVWIRFAAGGTWLWTQVTDDGSSGASFAPLGAGTRSTTDDITQFPSGNKALVIVPQWPGFPAGEADNVRELLHDQRGYNVTPLTSNAECTPEAFKHWSNYDIVYVGTHGGFLDDHTTWLATTLAAPSETIVPSDVPPTYKDDFDKNRLMPGNVYVGKDKQASYWHCNSEFISHYCEGQRFRSGAGVFINACSSLVRTDMADKLVGETGLGAAVYVGNTCRTPLADTYCGLLVGLVGSTNELPHNLSNAIASFNRTYVDKRGPDTWGIGPRLDSYTTADSVVTLSGSFGPTRGTVTVGSSPLQVSSWSDTNIECPLPTSSVEGDLVVHVGSLKSNPLPFSLAEWHERFDLSPVGIVASIVGPTNYPAFIGGFEGDECHWIVGGGAPDLVGWDPVDVDAGIEVTTGKSLRLWSNTAGMAVNASPGWLTVNGQAVPLIPGLRFHCTVSALAGSPTIEFGAFKSLSPTLTSFVTLDHGSGTYDIDLWQLFSTELGAPPEGFHLSVFQLHLWTMGEVTLDDLWISP